MKCGFCERELEVSLVPVGPGYQVSCTCECGAVWTYGIYSLGCMALIEKPRPVEDVEPYDDSDDWRLPLKHPAS